MGKSSVFDALTYAIRGRIPKLDSLLQAEKPQDYYLNRFHPGGVGTIELTLEPDAGGAAVTLTVTRDAKGLRAVSGPAGVDAEALLADLDREFVLLDGATFQGFIDSKALDRGRDFAGLLGLERYSTLRQQLQAVSNTKAFNTHFDTTEHAAKLAAAQRNAAAAKTAISADYAELVKEPLAPELTAEQAQRRCHAALHGISVLVDHCAERPFLDIDVDACIEAVRTAEGGPARERLAELLREQTTWSDANKALPDDAAFVSMTELVAQREEALKATSGESLRRLYRLSEEVLSAESWPSPATCPTCGRDAGASVLEIVQGKLGQYDAAELATAAVKMAWAAQGWEELTALEKLTLGKDEPAYLKRALQTGEAGQLTTSDVTQLMVHVKTLRERAAAKLTTLQDERDKLEGQLPQSLVLVTTTVEQARRLQRNWAALKTAEGEVAAEIKRSDRVAQIKTFLDRAASTFATAESTMSSARLARTEPLCQELFRAIMYSPVKPSLAKSKGGEDLSIGLAEFWGLKDLSAQALLSESFRNAFAISVYLAAASLYGGAPRFIVLDDVTSSLDAGHQHHLIEVIRTRFARPVKADGPQVIILSHDTMLEKLFNKHSGDGRWKHQRLEGTARTAVLPQTGAVNKVRDATLDLLNQGRVDDAAPRVRQYLEYTLHTVIDRCRIPVPLDVAFGDEKRTPGEYLGAIEAAVKLYKAAGQLVLTAVQEQDLQVHSAAIVGNYLSHWSTGQAHAFSAPALLGVMQAIDAFPECFKYEPVPGAPKKFYASLKK